MFNNCNELKFTSEKEWHSIRALGIGGSDCATVLDQNKYKSSYTLFLEKTGQKEQDDLSDNEAVKRGHAAEEHLRGLINAYYPDKKFFDPGVTFQRKDKPWMLANLDGVSEDLTEGLEIKTACVRDMSQWIDRIPQQYYCQILYYMAVTGLKKFTLFAAVERMSFDGETPRRYLIEHTVVRNEEEIEYIEKEVEKFWEKVKSKEWKEFSFKINI